jgi:hypothetical protein
MNNRTFSLAILLIGLALVDTSKAADYHAHSIYHITSYNLGAIFDTADSGNQRVSRDYQPLMITSIAADVLNLNSEQPTNVAWLGANPYSANTRGFALSATIDATNSISVQGAFGMTRNLWAPDSLNYENESSWEANLGIIYNFLDNLAYELHFGYMDAGDLFLDRNSYTGVESIIMVSNKITMSF